MNNAEKIIPPVNQRIRYLIDEKFGGSVRAFCKALGFTESQKVNRLFKIDLRNGKYPTPSIDILNVISKTFDISLIWLQYGEGEMFINNTLDNIATSDIISIPQSAWRIIEAQASSLKNKDEQINDLISQMKEERNDTVQLLKETIDTLRKALSEKRADADDQRHVATRAAAE